MKCSSILIPFQLINPKVAKIAISVINYDNIGFIQNHFAKLFGTTIQTILVSKVYRIVLINYEKDNPSHFTYFFRGGG